MNSITLTLFFIYLFFVVVYDKYKHEIYRNLMIGCVCCFALFLVVGCWSDGAHAAEVQPRGTYEAVFGERINIDQYERGLLLPLWVGYVTDDPSQPNHNEKCANLYQSTVPGWPEMYRKYCNVNFLGPAR